MRIEKNIMTPYQPTADDIYEIIIDFIGFLDP